ncbi:MAG: agmatinase [Candidatus Zixiibacteriota bacterium]
MTQQNYLGIPEENSQLSTSPYVILPVPYEGTVTYGAGTAYGPNAIIEASHEVELFDDELGVESYKCGIHTAPPVETTMKGPEVQNEIIYLRIKELLAQKKKVCMLGGEHSISYAPARACLENFPNLTVLQLDAHADLRDGYLGQKFSHAAVMRRIRDLTDKTVSVGIRNYSIEEDEYIKTAKVKIFSAREIHNNPKWIDEVLSHLSGDIYITIDLDGFDPSLVPATGTPEPGGLLWYPTLDLLHKVIAKCNLVSFDVVELAPIEGYHAADFLAAKLIYKIIGYDLMKRQK